MGLCLLWKVCKLTLYLDLDTELVLRQNTARNAAVYQPNDRINSCARSRSWICLPNKTIT